MLLAASTFGTVTITVVAFLVLLLMLVALLLFTKEKLSPSGPVTITINGTKKLKFPPEAHCCPLWGIAKFSCLPLVEEEEPVFSVNVT